MEFDLIIKNGRIYDGSGDKSYFSDIAIKNGKIFDISNLDKHNAKIVINAKHQVVCPGFIDVHSHADLSVHLKNHHQILEPLLRQGITTFVGGNCGMGLAPFSNEFRKDAFTYIEAIIGKNQAPSITWNNTADFFVTLEKRGLAMNCGMLIPHGLLRIAAKGMQNTIADKKEISIMKKYLEEGLEAGALGMSTGLMYFPGLGADENELIELAKVLSNKDRVFTCHIRSYSNTLDNAIEELMDISRQSGVRVQLSHLFWLPHVNKIVDGITNSVARFLASIYKHVKIPIPLDIEIKKRLSYIGDEIKKGMPMGFDVMPTGTGFTHALAFFPPWSLTGDRQKIINRLKDKKTRKRIYKSIQKGQSIWPHRDKDTWSMNFFKVMGFKSIFLMSAASNKNKKYEGMNFFEIGKKTGKNAFDAVCDMLIEEDGQLLVFETPTYPGDEFVERSIYSSIKDANSSIVTDSILFGFGKSSHLFYDCYPRIFSKYVREEKILTMEEAVRKSTYLPAFQLGIKDRGLLKKGFWADIVIFNPDTIQSLSTPQTPDVFPEGIDYVLVNGNQVVTPNGYFPEPRSGMLIRR
ncbi:MAG: amidohydrolase family protein [Desulfobacterales bacterium]|nr:amidohydrolase family protein [Desulfobacterales bacterium]